MNYFLLKILVVVTNFVVPVKTDKHVYHNHGLGALPPRLLKKEKRNSLTDEFY